MIKLTIDWIQLESAFEELSGDSADLAEVSHYFDTETGQVIALDETVTAAVEEIVEAIEEVAPNDMDWTEEAFCNAEPYESLSEWMKPAVTAAFQIEHGNGLERFKRIPRTGSRESFHWMEDFADTVSNESVREKLKAALKQRKPFRKFHEAMGSDRRLQQQWRAFQLARLRETVIDWLESIDILPLNPDESTYNTKPLPDLRKIMFAEVLKFVGIARELNGLHRIALIRSLATDKEFPKDIDLLVTIADECDLAGLARLGRKLAGRMAAHSAGADIFLASPDGKYLGRTCSWKNCGPGIRASCDALSCGVRLYLHDDLGSIQLSSKLIQLPPVQLWPEPKTASECPTDLIEQLIVPLLGSVGK